MYFYSWKDKFHFSTCNFFVSFEGTVNLSVSEITSVKNESKIYGVGCRYSLREPRTLS
jgi:hypothetical protein